MKNKKDIIYFVIAILSVSIIGLVSFIILNEDDSVKMNEVEHFEVDSDILSTDPKKTTYNYIKTNGTMGNLEKDVTEEKFKTNEIIFENSSRRLISLEKVKKATIDGSPLITGKEEKNIDEFANSLNFPFFYRVDNFKISEPEEEKKLKVYSENGPSEYDSISLFVSFDSFMIRYMRPTDTSYDGTHTEITNKETFENVKVTLVKSGDLWFVYDIENAEKLINERFSTWNGDSPSTIDYSKDEETGTFFVEGYNNIEEDVENE